MNCSLVDEKLTTELQVLLLSSRSELSSEELATLTDLSRQGVDWQEVCRLARMHRTHLLLYNNICPYLAGLAPESLLLTARSTLQKQAALNLGMSAMLLRLLAAFSAKGIKAVPFKGPVFTERFFGNVCFRSYCDLDILIDETALPEATKVLLQQNFTPLFPMQPSQLLMLAKTDNEYPFRHSGGVVVDLQWELTGGYTSNLLNLKDVQENLEHFSFLGREVELFGIEDQIVYLCIHGNQHTWEQLDSVCCLAETLRLRVDIDWDQVWQRAGKLHVERIVRIGLLLALHLCDAPVPEQVERLLSADAGAVKLARDRARKLLFSSDSAPAGWFSRRFVAYHWRSLDSFWLVVRYALRILFVPTRYDWQLYPLPVWLAPLHYLIRPFRLMWAGAKGWVSGAGASRTETSMPDN